MQEFVELRSGSQMPVFGLGTWLMKADDDVAEKAIGAALSAGYWMIDVAENHKTEEAIGRAIQAWLHDGEHVREQLFITVKLPHIGNRAQDVEKYLKQSLSRLQLEYVDLYLIHLPFGFVPDATGEYPAKNEDGSYMLDDTDQIAVWKAMEEQVEKGLASNIGVSNYNIEQLERTVTAAKIYPATIQVELHAYFQQPQLRACCAKLGIPITAYSPLGSPGAKTYFKRKYNYNHPEENPAPPLLSHPLVKDIATAHQKTPAQILLRHLVQQGIIVIPKSINQAHIRENAQIFNFELSEDEMEVLNSLDHGEAGRIHNFLWWEGVEKHPEYPFKLQEI